MNNQGTKPGYVIEDSFIKKSIPKIETIHDVYPKACLKKKFKIRCASFKDHLCLGRHKDANQIGNSEASYIVTKNYRVTYTYTIGNSKEGNPGEVTVPALMCTDLATIPRLLRFLLGIGRVGPHLEAVIVHDFLYIAWQLFAYEGADCKQHAKKEYKAFADNLFYCLLETSGVDPVKRRLMYRGVNSSIAWWYFEGKDKNISILDDENPCPCPLEILAEQGNPYAQNDLGVMYEGGERVTQDYEKAVFWYQRAAEQGYDVAQSNLGNMYDRGDGVAQDYQKAAEWYQRAAEQGYAQAQYNLGWLYYYGEGVPQDYQKAAEWYQKAAGQDHHIAQARLGVMFAKGYGVRQDDEKAMEWYQKSEEQIKKDAERGDDYAQYTLGWLYAQGGGVNPSMKEALKWLKKSADQDNPYAQKLLAELGE